MVSLIDDAPLLADGAMGTALHDAGLGAGEAGELWCVERPRVVRRVHRAHVDAGARVLLTNTFGASRFALARHGAADRVDEVNRAAAGLAREAAGPGRIVLGDVGPFGGFLAPLGDAEPGEVREAFREQVRALLAGGVDGIAVETMSAVEEAVVAVEAAREEGAGVVVGSMAYQATPAGYRTLMGVAPAEAARALRDAGVDVVGANCGTDLAPEDYVGVARAYRAADGDLPVMVQMNAGTPRLEGREVVYDLEPDAMAAVVPDLVGAGAAVVGGCCGTTAEHLRAVGRRLAPRG